MAKQPGRGHKRRASALERKATQHHDFVGDAAPERAEAEFQKRDRQQVEENREVVREMAAELRDLSAGVPADGSLGAEIPFRIPRSVDEARQVVRDAPEALREKARQRLDSLPEPAKTALDLAASTANILLAPARIGLHLAREVLRLPFTVIGALRHREA
ncbi:MAG TPA: hypothetical protein VFP52_03595 [Myxococcales bacterium]|nr:hypothetical protein [Myxococcales bacterium]HET9752011.1 hypothetical protein [Myxococcales bacterium]